MEQRFPFLHSLQDISSGKREDAFVFDILSAFFFVLDDHQVFK